MKFPVLFIGSHEFSILDIVSYELPSLSWLRIHLQCRRPWFGSWVRQIPWRRHRLLTPVFLGFLGGSAGKESACNAGDLGSILGWEDLMEKRKVNHPSLLAGEFHGLYSPPGSKESDMTERLSLSSVVYMCQFQSPISSHSHFPLGVHTFVLYDCVSISALQIGSSAPLSRSHVHTLIQDVCFSLSALLHSV